MSLSIFEATSFSGTAGCSTKISVPERYIEGRNQLTPHTNSQPAKKGSRKCQRRRLIMPSTCCHSGSSVGLSWNSSFIAIAITNAPTDATTDNRALQKLDCGVPDPAGRESDRQTVPEIHARSRRAKTGSSPDYAPTRYLVRPH